MKKAVLFIPAISLAAISLCAGTWAKPLEVLAEDSAPETSQVEEVSSVEPESSEAEQPKYQYLIKDAAIQYRDSDVASYAVGDAKIGSYVLSAEGWNEDAEPIHMTIKGNVTTKLESKIVYIYEYKPTVVTWNGNEIKPNDEKVYLLEKPSEPGEYDLTIYFTKEVITNPLDLTEVNWSSFLTVQNLMTIGSWAVLVVGMLVLYFLNRKYKKDGATTLDSVQEFLSKKVENVWGKEASKEMTKVFREVVKTSFDAIDGKLSKVDNNNATMVRCLLLMQENTPQARLAVIECLSKIDTSADSKSNEIASLIEAEMAKYKAEQEAREKALAEAKEANEAWKAEAEEAKEAEPEEPKEGDEFGTL